MEKLKILSLFSGIGSFEKALTNLKIDFDLIGFSETDKYAAEAYSTMHNIDKNLNLGDIKEICEKQLDDFNLMTYGFPCQDISASGKQQGFEKDSNTRSSLLWEAMRIAKYKKPKYMIAENVKNLVSKKFNKHFNNWIYELDDMGYNTYWKVLNAKDYGVPQNRERVFVISIRKDVDRNYKFPKPIPLKNELKTYLEDDALTPILHNIYGGFKESNARTFDTYSPTIRTSAGGGHIPSVIVKGCSLRTRSYMGQPQKLEIRKDNLSNTITTVPKDFMLALIGDTYTGKEILDGLDLKNKKGVKLVRRHNDKYFVVKDKKDINESDTYFFIRQMTSREAFRLMDYDDEDYEKIKLALNNTFYNGKDRSNSRLYGLAGNSIVVGALEEIFKELLINT